MDLVLDSPHPSPPHTTVRQSLRPSSLLCPKPSTSSLLEALPQLPPWPLISGITFSHPRPHTAARGGLHEKYPDLAPLLSKPSMAPQCPREVQTLSLAPAGLSRSIFPTDPLILSSNFLHKLFPLLETCSALLFNWLMSTHPSGLRIPSSRKPSIISPRLGSQRPPKIPACLLWVTLMEDSSVPPLDCHPWKGRSWTISVTAASPAPLSTGPGTAKTLVNICE